MLPSDLLFNNFSKILGKFVSALLQYNTFILPAKFTAKYTNPHLTLIKSAINPSYTTQQTTQAKYSSLSILLNSAKQINI